MATAKTTMKSLVSKLQTAPHSPTGMQKAGLDFLSEIHQGEVNIVEANNPLVYLLEVSAANTAAGAISYKKGLRYTYASLAKTEEDLHRFMSDEDYNEIYAQPGTTAVKVSISIESLLENGILNPVTSGKTLQIPKDTYITASGTELTMTKPVTVTKFANNAYIVYETLEDGSKNVLNHDVQKNQSELSWIEFTLTMTHLHIGTLYDTAVRSTAFSQNIELDREFHKVEVYHKKDGNWVRLPVTFNNDVYDLTTPTVIVTVSEKQLKLIIEERHITTGDLGDDIKTVVYTTGGKRIDVNALHTENVTISYRRLDNDSSLSQVEEPITNSTVVMLPTAPIENYRDALTFDELKLAVTNNNIGRNKYPVTRGDVGYQANKLGYKIYKAIDILTDRQYIAGRTGLSPEGFKNSFTTPMDMCVRRVDISWDKIKNISGVKKDITGERLTIPSRTIVSIDSLTGKIMTDTVSADLSSKALADKIKSLEDNSFYYCPFSLSVDYKAPAITVTPYRTDRPVVKSVYVKDRNTSTTDTINTYTTSMKYVDGHYLLRAVTKSTGTLHDMDVATADATLKAEISFKTGADTIFFDGVLVDKNDKGELVYEFKLPTDLKLEGEYITLLDEATRSVEYKIGLIHDFRIVYSYKNAVAGFVANAGIDVHTSDNSNGLNHDLLNIELASIVTGLWNHVTTIKTGDIYQKHDVNVPYKHTHDVYKRDDTGSLVGTEPDCSGTTVKIANAGDPVVVDGNIVYRYLAGTTVVDVNGVKVLANPTEFTHYLDMALIDARGIFSNNLNIEEYVIALEDKLYRDATTSLDLLKGKTLEKTSVHFKPIGTVGIITASTEFSREITIHSQTDMALELQVGSSVYNSELSRESIEKDATAIISEYLKREMLVRSELITILRKELGEAIIDVDITKFMNGNNVISITDDSYLFSIRKKIVAVSDNSYDLEDYVNIVFKNFDIS